MIKIIILFLATVFLLSSAPQNPQKVTWPEGRKFAVSLSYDDAINSQLDNAIPQLDKYSIKASFYVLPNSPVMKARMDEWKAAAAGGHELGNHSVYHPCRASLPDREWVPEHHDLDKYSVDQMVEEVTTANTFLQALDGKTERTFTPPCFESLASGQDYISKVRDQFVAIKSLKDESGFSVLWTPENVTGNELIAYIKNVPADVSLVNILFHGVGGDYLTVSAEAHEELLKFLSENRETYYVDTFINIMKYAKTQGIN